MMIKILIPIYNDWQSVSKLLDEININTSNLNAEISIIIINDASSHDRKEETKSYENLHSIKILKLSLLYLLSH